MGNAGGALEHALAKGTLEVPRTMGHSRSLVLFPPDKRPLRRR